MATKKEPEELIEIQDHGNSILRRIASILPDKYPEKLSYNEAERQYTRDYVKCKSAKVKKMVDDTNRIRHTMHKAKDDLDHLDREIERLQEDLWRRKARSKYFVPDQPSDFVLYKWDKYSLQDFLPKRKPRNNTA